MYLSRVSFDIMHTRMDVLLFEEKAMADRLFDMIERRILRLETLFNRFDESSELSLINREAGEKKVKASEEIADILSAGLNLKERCLGYFDVTKNRETIEIDSENSIFIKKGTELDLGAIAKGYALDCIRDIFEKAGVERAFVSFGESSILGWGAHPMGNHWPLGAKNFFTPDEVIWRCKIRNEVLSGSGTLQRREGKLLPHLKNPLTGEMVTVHRVSSVITKSGTEGDALATALAVAESNDERQRMMRNFPDARACVHTYEDRIVTDKIIYDGTHDGR